MDRSEGRVYWALYRDATCSESSCVLSGSLPLAQVQVTALQTKQNPSDRVSKFALESTGYQLVPELQQRVWDLLEKQNACNNQDDAVPMDVSDDVFPVAVEDLTLGLQATSLGLNGETLLYCKLQLDTGGDKGAERQEADWFLWKLKRAAEYRVRGNEAFKKESYRSAVTLYERALAWLEPPTSRSEATLDEKIEYSADELQQVNPVAVACYANMATCYSKLDGDGDVDRCVAAASKALELDDTHVKARYRRSQAYLTSKEFNLAVADLNKLRELEPDNKLFRAALTRAQTAKTQFRKKQQSAFANLFDK
ncbi:Peptidyl-prolyl cis-trans isomerase FKBP4 [Phytophthora citrophthora]|uniref:peptidylprolyl isomerase n=1 Tax=Phytophthora citrophthora TaxID=4793 RepID=A0AAD9FYV8_9STRA|nr:Peptidyl-prolyl cis-trans isomerase FKBP4 [Phytophthora citrophthora]